MFNNACKLIDPNYNFQGGRLVSALFDEDYFLAAYTILLRANVGRFAAVPLIRSGMEVLLTRRLLRAPTKSKFANCLIIPIGRFNLADFLERHGGKLGIKVSIGVDSIRRLYDWGSVAAHRGWRSAHCDMWFAALIGQSVSQYISIDSSKFNKNFDAVLDELIKIGWIRIEKRRQKARK